MKYLHIVWKETVGMFVDDGSLASMAIALIAIVTLLVAGLKLSPAFAEALLPLGLGLILIASVYRGSKRSGSMPIAAVKPPSGSPAKNGSTSN